MDSSYVKYDWILQYQYINDLYQSGSMKYSQRIRIKISEQDFSSSLRSECLDSIPRTILIQKNSLSREFRNQMVPGGGIEPTTFSLEGYCSSTELPGRIVHVAKIEQLTESDDQKNILIIFCMRRIVKKLYKSNGYSLSFFSNFCYRTIFFALSFFPSQNNKLPRHI